MANLHLVTGYAGKEHITSSDQGSFNAAIMGTGEFVLERGKQFEAQVISNNTVRVFDGDLLMQGRHIRLKENTYVDLFFENGMQGYKRVDLIVVRYEKDAVSDVETASLVVIKGVPSEDSYTIPEKITGNIITDHALQNDTILYHVKFDGLGIQEPEKVFSTVYTVEKEINDIKKEMRSHKSDVQKQVDELKTPESLKNTIGDAEYTDNAVRQGLIKKFVRKSYNSTDVQPDTPNYSLTVYGSRGAELIKYKDGGYGSFSKTQGFDYIFDWRYTYDFYENTRFDSLDAKGQKKINIPLSANRLGPMLFLNFFIAETSRKDTNVVVWKTDVNNKIGQACICVPTQWIFASTFERYRITGDTGVDNRPGDSKVWGYYDLEKLLIASDEDDKDENIIAYVNIPIVKNFNSNSPTYDNIIGALIVNREGFIYPASEKSYYGRIGSMYFKLPKKTVKGTDLSVNKGNIGADGSTWYTVFMEMYTVGFTTNVMLGNFEFNNSSI